MQWNIHVYSVLHVHSSMSENRGAILRNHPSKGPSITVGKIKVPSHGVANCWGIWCNLPYTLMPWATWNIPLRQWAWNRAVPYSFFHQWIAKWIFSRSPPFLGYAYYLHCFFDQLKRPRRLLQMLMGGSEGCNTRMERFFCQQEWTCWTNQNGNAKHISM